MVERFFPMLEIVRVLIDMPDVRHILFLQISVNPLADANQSVFVAAGDKEELQLLLRFFGIRHEFSGRLRIRRR